MTPDAVLKCPVCGSTTGLNGKPFHNSRALGGHIGRAHTHMLKTHLTPELHFTGKPTVSVSSVRLAAPAENGQGYIGFGDAGRTYLIYPAGITARRQRNAGTS